MHSELNLDIAGEMLRSAEEALQHCFPEPRKGYAAAVLTEQGNIYTGASYCSDTQTLTMHGEATAMAHAAAHGEPHIVAITGPNCHCCKQLIYENSLRSGIDVQIVMNEGGKIVFKSIHDLMPYPWPERSA